MEVHSYRPGEREYVFYGKIRINSRQSIIVKGPTGLIRIGACDPQSDLRFPSDGASEPARVELCLNKELIGYGRLRRFRGALDIVLE